MSTFHTLPILTFKTRYIGFSRSVRNDTLQDTKFINFIHDWIVGVTGLDNTKVVPKWQLESINPYDNQDWLAFGVLSRKADTYAYLDADNQLTRYESLRLGISFYGPNADRIASEYREGVQVDANRTYLQLLDIGLVQCGTIISVPEMVKYKWIYRQDMWVELRKRIGIQYQSHYIESSSISISTETNNLNVGVSNG